MILLLISYVYSAPHAFAFIGSGNYLWTKQTAAGARTWLNIVSSSDGSILAAPDLNGYIYVSTTTGATWTPETSAGSRIWATMGMSSNGAVMVDAAQGSDIYVSTTTGATWTDETGPGAKTWIATAASSNGTVMAAAPDSGDIYVSTTTGATWTDETGSGSRSWETVAVSGNGSVIVGAVWGGDLYVSTTTGATWTHVTSIPAQDWVNVAMSSDGSHIVAVSYSDSTFTTTNGTVWISTDSGATWTQNTNIGLNGWYVVGVTPDGQEIGLGAGNVYGNINPTPPALGHFYTSMDGGAHWTEEAQLGQDAWNGVAFSSDGKHLAVVSSDIWTGIETYGSLPGVFSPPVAPTLQVSVQSSTSASVQLSSLQDNGISTIGYAYAASGVATTTRSFPAGGQTSLSGPIIGLSCGTTYSIWGFATNTLGTTNSTTQTFTTQACADGQTPQNNSSTGLNGGASQAPSPTIKLATSHPATAAATTTPAATSTPVFPSNLKKGDSGEKVIALQDFLIRLATGPAAAALASSGASGYFGTLTKAALVELQKTAGISPASGYFGPFTRLYIRSHF